MSDIILVEDSESMAVAYMGYLRKGGIAACHVMTEGQIAYCQGYIAPYSYCEPKQEKTMPAILTAHATARGGRAGHVETDDKKLSLDIAMPGSGREGVNPEQLFACGYSACFGGAVDFIARQKQLTSASTVKTAVTLNKDDSGFSLSVVLDVTLEGIDDALAAEVVAAAHAMCPYSKATRGNIAVMLTANGKPVAA